MRGDDGVLLDELHHDALAACHRLAPADACRAKLVTILDKVQPQLRLPRVDRGSLRDVPLGRKKDYMGKTASKQFLALRTDAYCAVEALLRAAFPPLNVPQRERRRAVQARAMSFACAGSQ